MSQSVPKAVVRAVFFGAMTAVLLIPYLVMLGTVPSHRHRIAGLFYKGCLAATGIKVCVHGTPNTSVALVAANHASYLDIPVLGSVLSDGVFVAKREVASWPLFGLLARIARTEFVSRSGAQAAVQRTRLADRMNRGESLLLFPEGTSTDGSHVRPFKSTLFAALDEVKGTPTVQPVTIVYSRTANGTPLSQRRRERYTWFGDMTLAPHLWAVFGAKGCQVDVIFHAPLAVHDFSGRKALARQCEAHVCTALDRALSVPAYDTGTAPHPMEAPAE